MKNIKLVLAFLISIASNKANCQDYFEDSKGEGFPMILQTHGSSISARVNSKDNSLKASVFRYLTNRTPDYIPTEAETTIIPPTGYATTLQDNVTYGLGANIKGKTEQSIGSLFSEGAFSPGFTGGLYFARRGLMYKPKGLGAKTKALVSTLLLGFQYSRSSLRLFDVNKPFDQMKIDQPFDGYSASLSWFRMEPLKADNLIWGASLELAKKNNYSTLDQYEIRDYLVNIVDPTSGGTRTILLADEDGYGYNKNNYKQFKTITFRPNINYIPKSLNHRAAFLFYPSWVIVEESRPRLNFDLGIHLLEKGDPALSIFGLFFSFSDVANGREIKDRAFLERSFSVGITAAFNLFTAKQL